MIDRLLHAHEARYDAMEAKAEYHRMEAERMRTALKSCPCPGGGWTGMPEDLEPTIGACMIDGSCGCIYGDALRDGQQQHAQAGQWLPIETAPKNRMLLCGFFNSLGKWRSMHAQYRDDLPQHDDADAEDEPAAAGWYEGSLEAEVLFPVRPTHWQLLPAPPATGASFATAVNRR